MTAIGLGDPSPFSSPLASVADVRFAYTLLLGRDVESEASLQRKLVRPVGRFAADFLDSPEFRDEVALPILAGRPVEGGRFPGAPTSDVRRWAAHRLLSCAAAADLALAADGWTLLWRALLADPAMARTFDVAFGPGEAAVFDQALLLRRAALSTVSSPPSAPALSRARLPALSVVIAPQADMLLTAAALTDPAAPVSVETLLVYDAAGPAAQDAWLDTLMDARRPVRRVCAPAGGEVGAALALARGDYLLLGAEHLAGEQVARCSEELIVHDRPEALVTPTSLVIRVDACARALREGPVDLRIAACELATRVERGGGRVEHPETLRTPAR